MNKKLISMVIVLALVLTLLPVTALAGGKDDRNVAVVVYGETLTDLFFRENWDMDALGKAVKSELENTLAAETLPEVELYLVNKERNLEYHLTNGGVGDASFFSSFQVETGGVIGWLDAVIDWVKDLFGWAVSDIDTVGELYDIYGAYGVKDGTYTLEVRSVAGNQYKVYQPASGNIAVKVDGGKGIFGQHVEYKGYEVTLGEEHYSTGSHWYTLGYDIEFASYKFSAPGIFLEATEPGFRFTSADVGGNPLPGTEFLLVNRDEALNLVKAALTLGKDTFSNAMDEIDNGAFTWEELNVLNYDLLNLDLEGQQINLDYEEAYKLIKTYWALMAASGSEPLKDFMSKDTNIRIPAILKATADENGVVSFTNKSNVTVVWSVEILLEMANLVGKEIAEISDEDILKIVGDFEDSPILKAVLLLVIQEAKQLMVDGIELWNEYGETATEAVNTWIYPILQNDHLLEYAQWAIDHKDWLPFDITIPPVLMDVMEYLPQHGLLTTKMPEGNYIMMEIGVPNGYFHNPLFYTMKMTYNTESSDMRDWVHVTVGNAGLIAPYFAEDYYKQLRDLNLNAEADKVLALINDNRSKELFGSDTPIQDIIEGDADMTARALEMLVSTVYQVSGKTDADPKEAAASLLPYFKSSGGTVQNLLKLCDKIIKTNKSVITDNITVDWKFYTPTTSMRTNAALRFKAFMQELSKAIVTDDKTITGKVNTAVKDTIDKIVNSVDTKNYTEPYVTAAKKAVKDKVSGILSNVLQKAVATVKNTIKTIAGGGKLPIIKW